MKRKIWGIGIAVLLITALAGCGSKEKNTNASQTAAAKDYVYRVEEWDLNTGMNSRISSIMKAGDSLYTYGYEYHENGQTIHLFRLGEDGSILSEHKIEVEENSNYMNFRPDGAGNYYAVKNQYLQDEADPENYQDLYYFVKLSETGEELFSIQLNDIPEMAEKAADGYFYVGNLFLIENTIYLNVMETIAKFDLEGNFKGFLGGGDGADFEGLNLIALEDNKAAALSYEETGAHVSTVDLQAETLGEKYKLPGSSYEYSLFPGIGYDLYLANSYGVYGYNIGDEDRTQLMSYIDSDLGINNVYNVTPLNDKEFIAMYDDAETMDTMVGKFIKVDPKDVKDKTVLTLACAGLDWDVRRSVVKFNKTNENYRITIQDYSSLYGSETDYNAGINRLNADIVSGKVPDIIQVNSLMPFESYISKNLLEDLKPYIESDTELDINQFMPNIIEAFSVEGRLYRLTPSYTISTVIAKTSDVGEERGWTVQEAKELLASKPEGTQLFNNTTRDSILMNSMTIAGDQFIDWETGKCSFDSDGFIQMLEFIKEFPEELDETAYSDDYWNNYETLWREGKVICQMTGISNIRDFNYMEKGIFGEQVTMIGFPSSNENGSAIVANLQLAMSAKSSNKEGVWEFMRYFLTDEYQENNQYALPLSIKRLDAMIEEAKKVPTYEDEEGNLVEQKDTYYLGGMEIPIDPMTDAEAERIKKELYSFTEVYNYNENLIKIIEEEAAPFFSGQKNAKEVAEIIQSRAQIYVNENR